LTWGRDERWHCFSAEHEGYGPAEYHGQGASKGAALARPVTRSSWSRDELLPEEEAAHWARYGEP